MNNPKRIGQLLYSKRRGELTDAEETELTVWRRKSPANEKLFRDKMDPEKLRESMIELYKARDRVFEKLKKNIPELANVNLSDDEFDEEPVKAKHVQMPPFPKAAAIGTAIILGMICYFILRTSGCMHKHVKADPTAMHATPEGMEDDVSDFELAEQAANGITTEINAIGDYDCWASSRDGDKKRQYEVASSEAGLIHHLRLILPDSTWIWVDKFTRIKYPRNFSQDTIHISMDGAAYFEGKRDSLHPYIISLLPIRPSEDSGNHKSQPPVVIESSSAHFDVNAYSDSSAILITAITGNLFIGMDSTLDNPRSGVQLFAGQQAEIRDGKLHIIEPVDVNKILSRVKWYDGDKTDIHQKQRKQWLRFFITVALFISISCTGAWMYAYSIIGDLMTPFNILFLVVTGLILLIKWMYLIIKWTNQYIKSR